MLDKDLLKQQLFWELFPELDLQLQHQVSDPDCVVCLKMRFVRVFKKKTNKKTLVLQVSKKMTKSRVAITFALNVV